ncbi:beta-glucan synthesis-associated [Dendrothele bispora CBS 962.96]|uniref:Beta-glucan synthesis-associated n=1 Tax=Dendrothele bispora (strain CBS 962.96) TaxID=1314807 RepID=A0A4S8MLR0_DENBC|nr:beta-glucan synthesis-associated [Dendrothele bispora CBS 962.96]
MTERNPFLPQAPGSKGKHKATRSVSSSYNPIPMSTVRHARSRTTAADSVTQSFSLSPNPRDWGSNLSPNFPEPDDDLHSVDPKRDRKNDRGAFFSARGVANIGCLVILVIGLLVLLVGYPVASFARNKVNRFNAQKPPVTSFMNLGLIDPDTPPDALTITSVTDGKTKMKLVFSDEFNVDGRSFYPGDDPYWEAVDLHYWGTNNLEWYDPAAVTTNNGSLVVTLSKKDPAINHDMSYMGGMITTWNKLCFTGGAFYTSVNLPGSNNVLGLWPAIWAMGNLGRAGYGASLDGTWPYSYDSCDVGTLKNQSLNGEPAIAATSGLDGGPLSFQPGQRLSRCTCQGESHPGPVHAEDQSYVGRAAPEIDVFEAQIQRGVGAVSQSGQWAPYNANYDWFNTSDNLIIYDSQVTQQNPDYKGAAYQQTTSGVSITNQECYQLNGTCFSVYAFEYKPGFDDGYITWVNDDKPAWTIKAGGVAADPQVQIGARPIPQEPMYLLVNLGISENFGGVDFDHLQFPAIMTVDWIRLYQDENNINIGCDPENFPTAAYIEMYKPAYTNPNLTTWSGPTNEGGYAQPVPKNKLIDAC